jgi:hypothetical protein
MTLTGFPFAGARFLAGAAARLADRSGSEWPLLLDRRGPDSTALNGDARFESMVGSSGRTRTYNPSVNSRMACSRLALQLQDLDVRNVDFLGIGGTPGGTRRDSGIAQLDSLI